MDRYWNVLRMGEMVLILPATFMYGLMSGIGVPFALIGMTSPGTSESNMRLLPGILALSIGGLIGLAALWRAVTARQVPRERWVVAGLCLGVVASVAFLLVRFAQDGFDVVGVFAREPELLPLIAVAPVGVAQLIPIVRSRTTSREEMAR